MSYIIITSIILIPSLLFSVAFVRHALWLRRYRAEMARKDWE